MKRSRRRGTPQEERRERQSREERKSGSGDLTRLRKWNEKVIQRRKPVRTTKKVLLNCQRRHMMNVERKIQSCTMPTSENPKYRNNEYNE